MRVLQPCCHTCTHNNLTYTRKVSLLLFWFLSWRMKYHLSPPQGLYRRRDKKEEGKEETDREGMGRVGAGRGGGRREREE